jgi:predicted amidohydrolase
MTGKDHWEVLLRARAIENQSYVLAPAQVGRHSEKRVTYGHSMVVDPWGAVIAQASDGEGLAIADVRPEVLSDVRLKIPALSHRRL